MTRIFGQGAGSALHNALDPAASQASSVAWLWWIFFWTICTVFVAVCLGFGLALFRKRRVGEVPDEKRAEQTVGILVAIVVLILMGLLGADFATDRAIASSAEPKDSNLVSIKVTSHQWWWEFQYQNSDPTKLFSTANEIHLPLGRVVHFDLNSEDVIHSFWIPNLMGKKDTVPGHPTSTWIRTEREGIYRGRCAQFCGLQHAHMDFIVVIESPQTFDAWTAGQQQEARTPSDPSKELGRQVFVQGNCIMCHTIQGTPGASLTGPDLTHFGSRPMIGAFEPNTMSNLDAWIADPSHPKPGVLMPPNTLPENQRHALVDYLESLK